MGLIRICPCECSATYNVDFSDATLSVVICPDCDASRSRITYSGTISSTHSVTSFESERVNPSFCLSNGGTTILRVSGKGIAETRTGTYPAVFHVELDDLSPDVALFDSVSILITWVDDNGQIQNDFQRAGANHGDIVITECP